MSKQRVMCIYLVACGLATFGAGCVARKLNAQVRIANREDSPLGGGQGENRDPRVAKALALWKNPIRVDILPIQYDTRFSSFTGMVLETHAWQPSSSSRTTDRSPDQQLAVETQDIEFEVMYVRNFSESLAEARQRYGKRDAASQAVPSGIGQDDPAQNVNLWQKLIDDKVDFVLEQYRDRRNWSDDFRAGLRRTARAYAVASTYISAYQQLNGTRKLVGTLRLIRAPFGVRVERQAGSSHAVSTHYGMWGPLIRTFALGDARNAMPHPWEGSPVIDPILYALSQSPAVSVLADDEDNRAKAKVFQDWGNSPVLLLPMESDELGLGQRLPRPATLEEEPDSFRNKRDLQDLLQRAKLSYTVAADHRVSWGAGEIIEPGNFAIIKDFNSQVYLHIFARLLSYVMDDSWSKPYAPKSRMIYTYNDLPRLYTRLGFEKIPGSGTITKNGTTWTLLQARPEQLLLAFDLTAQKMSSEFESVLGTDFHQNPQRSK